MEISGNTTAFENTATYDQAMKRPAPDEVDLALGKELEQRAQYAANEANWFEESARRHRAVEQACVAALEKLNGVPQPQQSVSY